MHGITLIVLFFVGCSIGAFIGWPREPAAKKCARLGHVEQKQTQRGMRKTTWDERGAVAINFREERCICSRCKTVITEPREIEARATHSWSAPQSIWDEFNDKGRWIERQWSAS